MVYKWVYGDGELELASGMAKGIHHYMLLEKIEDKLGHVPENYSGGVFREDSFSGSQFDQCEVTWPGDGNPPTAAQIKYLIQQKLHRYTNVEGTILSRVLEDKFAASGVEDTEPEFNFGFLKHPHEDLYPPAFEGGDKITNKAAGAIKAHVLNQLELNEYSGADQWIYFTIYGSGISYNWDEDGDFDVQMWIDVAKYNEAEPEDPQTADELVAEVRRIVQMVNFPSFKEIGLFTNDEDGGEGAMLIQYYPKPGEGTAEENLASKPYACYDLENDEWLVEPFPLTPEFYGEHFLSVMQKAEDIAVQAEALLEQLQRNTISWQFWTAMLKEDENPKYQEALDMAERNAIAEKQGIKTLFDGVFGGRAKAYSDEGEGIQDERDVIQKLLEVWGVFQRLKHFARQELPWDEQEMPAEKESRWPWQKPDEPTIPTVADEYGEEWKNYVQPIDQSYVGPQKKRGPWDFRADPNNRPPYTYYTRWLWTPTTRLHVWNPPMDEREIYHGDYLQHLPEGKNLRDGLFDAPSGYLFGKNNVHYYDDIAWDKWGAEALADIAKYQGGIGRLTNNFNWRNGYDGGGSSIQKMRETSFNKFADWSEIMQNAQELRNTNAVQITSNGAQHVEGTVASQSEPGTVYNTSFDRQDPNSSAITTWNCDCPWGSVSWGRTRQWKKYEGRPCKHTLAMYWQSLAQPLDEERPEAQGQGQLFNPSDLAPTPGGPNQIGQVPTAQPPSAQPPMAAPPSAAPPAPPPISQPVPMGQGGTVSIPGALSKVKRSTRNLKQKHSSFQNGQVIVNRIPLWGIDRDNNQQMIPVGSQGEALWSDDNETIAIFPTNNGILEPHLVRVQSETKNFRPSRGKTPFVRRKR